MQFTDQQEADAIEFFMNTPIIYDKKLKDYKNKHKKDTAWAEGAKTIGVTEAELMLWYRNMRTRLGRLVKDKLKSGSGAEDLTDRDKWILDRFAFLRTYCTLYVQNLQSVSNQS